MDDTNKLEIQYDIHNKHAMTPNQLKKKSIKQNIKIEHEKLDTEEGESNKDEEESTTSAELSEENSTYDTHTEATEDSKVIETHQVHTLINKSTQDGADSATVKHVTDFELPTKENGGQEIGKELKTPIYTLDS